MEFVIPCILKRLPKPLAECLSVLAWRRRPYVMPNIWTARVLPSFADLETWSLGTFFASRPYPGCTWGSNKHVSSFRQVHYSSCCFKVLAVNWAFTLVAIFVVMCCLWRSRKDTDLFYLIQTHTQPATVNTTVLLLLYCRFHPAATCGLQGSFSSVLRYDVSCLRCSLVYVLVLTDCVGELVWLHDGRTCLLLLWLSCVSMVSQLC